MSRVKPTMTIDNWIVEAAKKYPDKAAIVYQEQTISYAQLAQRIEERSNSLRAASITHGDRVAWYGLNHPEVFILLFACARLGAIFVPINWRLAASEINAVVNNCEPVIVFYDAHYEPQAKALCAPHIISIDAVDTFAAENSKVTISTTPSIKDPLLLVYTSGSTGRPKGAVLAQQSLISNAKMSVDAYQMTPDDKALVVLPLFHVGGLNILPTPAFSIGATVLLHEKFEPEKACLDLQKATLAITVPTVLQAIMQTTQWSSTQFESLRALSIGSTDVPIQLIQEVHARDIPMIQIYGATETGPFAIYQNIDEALASVGSVGRKGCDCDIRLVMNGKDVAPGEAGEIWVKGDNVLLEYWRDDQLSKDSLNNGWFRTGDVARIDEQGLYWFTDRIKHVIISGGENIYPTEIERVLRQVPGIVEVAVIGVADDKWGEIPVAVVVTKTPMTESEVLAPLDGQIARYKHPKAVRFMDALPRNVMGKVVAAEVKRAIQ